MQGIRLFAVLLVTLLLPAAASAQVPLLGDANLDGDVNFLDIAPFISILSSDAYLAEADINEDGAVNFLDISPFIIRLTDAPTMENDWDGLPVPAEQLNADVSWELVEALSDSFNYETPYGSNKGSEFNEKWEDGFINAWTGPGNTVWTPNNSRVTAGNLELKATSLNAAANTNNFSAVHARTSILFPVYIETRVKVMNSVMANAVWLLSSNSSEEIDIVEAYGSSFSESKNSTREWFAQRMHLSHHTFDRSVSPVLDYQPPTSSGSYYQLQPVPSYWRDNFYTIGVYWRDPFHLEYYIDGSLVRTVSGAAIIDPFEYRNGNGLSLPETIIFSGAAQTWQVNQNVWPTVNELAVEENNVFKIDWIRTYERIGGDPYVAP